jgi:hypothetical protein
MRLHYPGMIGYGEFGEGASVAFISISDLQQMLSMASVAYTQHAEQLRSHELSGLDSTQYASEVVTNFQSWARYANDLVNALEYVTKISAPTVFTDSVYPAPTVEMLEVRFSDGHTCPRCKGGIPSNERRGAYMGAISRRDNSTEICSDCGNAEAMDDFLASERGTR